MSFNFVSAVRRPVHNNQEYDIAESMFHKAPRADTIDAFNDDHKPLKDKQKKDGDKRSGGNAILSSSRFGGLAFGYLVDAILGQQKKPVLAVTPIKDPYNKLKPDDVESATEYLRTLLLSSERFAVVAKGDKKEESTQDTVKELKKESYGPNVDEKSRLSLVDALTADSLLECEIGTMGNSCVLNCSLVSVEKEIGVKGAHSAFDCSGNGLKAASEQVALQLTGVKATEPAIPPFSGETDFSLKNTVEEITLRQNIVKLKDSVLEEEIKRIKAIKDLPRRDMALHDYSFEMAVNGKFESALLATQMIKRPELKDASNLNVIWKMNEAGKFEDALKTSPLFSDPHVKEYGLVTIVWALSQAHNFEWALQIVDTITDPHWKSIALSEIAIDMSEIGRFGDALELTNRLEEPEEKLDAISYIVKNLAKAGKFDEAFKVAHSIRDNVEIWEKAMVVIATEKARAGMLDEALIDIHPIKDAERKYWGLADIAISTAEAGNLNKALEIIETIGSYHIKASSYIQVAAFMHTKKEKSAAIKALERSIDSARLVEEPDEKSSALLRATSLMIEMGSFDKTRLVEMFNETLEAIKGITDETEKNVSIGLVSKNMASIGLFVSAIKTAAIETRPDSSFLSICHEMCNAGDFKAALEVVPIIKDPVYKAWAQEAIVKGMAQAGMIKESLELVRLIERQPEKTAAFVTISSAAVNADLDKEEIKAIFKETVDNILATNDKYIINFADLDTFILVLIKAGLSEDEIKGLLQRQRQNPDILN